MIQGVWRLKEISVKEIVGIRSHRNMKFQVRVKHEKEGKGKCLVMILTGKTEKC